MKKALSVVACIVLALSFLCMNGLCEEKESSYQVFDLQLSKIIYDSIGKSPSEIYDSSATFQAAATTFLLLDLSMYDVSHDTGTEIKDNALVILSNPTYLGIQGKFIFAGGYFDDKIAIVKYDPKAFSATYIISEVSIDGEKALEEFFGVLDNYCINDSDEVDFVLEQVYGML